MFIFRRTAHIFFEDAVKDSAQYAKEHMKNSIVMFDETRERMWNYSINSISKEGHITEFGTYRGESTNYIAKKINDKTLHAFDSLQGLKENWSGYEWEAGSFALGEKPFFVDNVNFVEGWFDESLPGWLEENPGEIAYIHIDSDTYESANTILTLSGPERINSGTIILFGEYFGYPNWREHQYKAWQEFVSANNLQYEYLGFNKQQVLVKVL